MFTLHNYPQTIQRIVLQVSIERWYHKSLAALALTAVQVANADFWLYSQQSNDIVDGGGGGFQTQELLISSGEVACGDGVAIPGNFYNDASSGGH